MITNELLAFIKEEMAQGVAEDEIKKSLVGEGGWTDFDVQEAFQAIGLYSHTYQGAVERAMQSANMDAGAATPTTLGTPESLKTSLGPDPIQPKINIEPAPKPAPLVIERTQATPEPLSISPKISPKVSTESTRSEIHFSPLPNLNKGLSKPVETSGSLGASSATGVASPITPPNVNAPRVYTPAQTPAIQKSSLIASVQNTPVQMPTEHKILDTFVGKGNSAPSVQPVLRATSQAKIIKPSRHIFRKIFIFFFILLVLAGGFIFAYLSGFVPVKIPQLESVADRLSVMLGIQTVVPEETPNVPQPNVSGGEFTRNPPSVEEIASSTVAYYTDRVRIFLPSGTVTSVTSVAASLASELRGRVANCNYTDKNECTLVVPAKTTADLDKVLEDLSTDKRIKGAEKVVLQ